MGLPDIQLRTGALADFAGNNQLDIDVESIRQLPAVAGQGKSLMQEGTDFHTAHKQAGDAVVAQFEAIQRGQYGIRERAEASREIYVTGEARSTQAQLSVEPFTTAPPVPMQPGQPAPPAPPTQSNGPADPTVLA